MSQTLVWSACNHLASDDFIPNTKNVGRWLLQTHALDNVDNIENEIRSWFLCIFRQLSASNVTAPFLDSLQLERVLSDAIDSSLLSVKVQIESFQNKQKKAHKNFKRENSWISETQAHNRDLERQVALESAETTQEHIRALEKRNESLAETLSHSKARVELLINVVRDKDLLQVELESRLAEKDLLLERIEKELERKTWRLQNSVELLVLYKKSEEWRRERYSDMVLMQERQKIFEKKLQRRIEYLERKLISRNESPELPIDLL